MQFSQQMRECGRFVSRHWLTACVGIVGGGLIAFGVFVFIVARPSKVKDELDYFACVQLGATMLLAVMLQVVLARRSTTSKSEKEILVKRVQAIEDASKEAQRSFRRLAYEQLTDEERRKTHLLVVASVKDVGIALAELGRRMQPYPAAKSLCDRILAEQIPDYHTALTEQLIPDSVLTTAGETLCRQMHWDLFQIQLEVNRD